MEIILLLIRLFLAAVLLAAGVGKLLDLKGSEKAAKNFGIPEEFAKYFAIALPAAEIFFAILLLPTTTAWFGAIAAFLLLAVFTGGMIWQMAQGNAPDCHCFGAIHSEPVSTKSLIRNVLFLILALFAVAQGRDNQGLSFAQISDELALQLILGLAVVGLLVSVIFYLKKISEQQIQIMRRIEIIELTANEGGREIERENLPTENKGLLTGSPAPDFTLPDLGGKNVSLENLLSRKKALLFFFVSPTCSPCEKLLPEIEEWQKDLREKVEFVFVSSGGAKENAEKIGGNDFKKILLQKEREVAELFGAKWTPTAILVNSEGRIASRAAIGDKAIRELFENIKLKSADGNLLFAANGNGSHLGEIVPEFLLPEISGGQIGSKDLSGREILIIYWSLACGYCEQMLEDLRAWEKEFQPGEPDLLLLSSGDAEANRALNLQSPVVLDDSRQAAEKLGLNGTPSAILISSDGRIISEPAVGAEQIWTLIGKRK